MLYNIFKDFKIFYIFCYILICVIINHLLGCFKKKLKMTALEGVSLTLVTDSLKTLARIP